MVYVIHVEELERQVLGNRQIAATLMAAGAKKMKLPELADARAEFERLLHEAPARISPDRRMLLEALGVSDGSAHRGRRTA